LTFSLLACLLIISPSRSALPLFSAFGNFKWLLNWSLIFFLVCGCKFGLKIAIQSKPIGFLLVIISCVVCLSSHARLLLCAAFSAAVMETEGFDYLEDTCPSLLSDLLATVAVVDDDLASLNRKRGVSGNQVMALVGSVERRTRRKL
jgi:hypothetical protein